jgi:hypothetical protein
MKHLTSLPCLAAGLVWLATVTPAVQAAQSAGHHSEPIPVAELGAKAGAQYQGDGLSVAPTPEGAHLRCVFQKLEGQVTPEGLWLVSTVEPQTGEKFRVVARAVGRPGALTALPPHGTVAVADKLARCVRPGLIEEYSVSVDGVRQDFVVAQRPAGDGPLRVELDVTGAKAEALVNGARLVLDGSGRKIAYSRLQVVDARGKDLTARMEVTAERRLAVLVEDAAAAYPMRIDPTFSDEDWISMGGLPGSNGYVSATMVDGSGNLYIGGSFTVVGEVLANSVAKWNGSAWSALGSGVNSNVLALAVSGSDLYVGGYFTTAGGSAANYVAKWNGSSWSALGSGLNSDVYALAVSGSDLYVGGYFTTAGGSAANCVAKWNGSSWSALGSGLNSDVYALAVSGSDLYVGGSFTMAGTNSVNQVAKWNGSNWTGFGSGVDRPVYALAVSGSDLYVGGTFTMAGGSAANGVAKWNGSSWSSLGSGMGGIPWVYALAVSGSDLYVGGYFTMAGDTAANYVARWNGSGWSTLGSGINNVCWALAVSGTNLYAGGSFGSAGGSHANRVAEWNGSTWSSLGSGLSSEVSALAVSGSDLYVGGSGYWAGDNKVEMVSKWNGSAWSALGVGEWSGDPDWLPEIYAMAVSGSNLYVGGLFTTADGSDATLVAKWNGSTWSALGEGVQGDSYNDGSYVSALAVSGSDLYVGGAFTTAGTNRAMNVAKWDGSAWSALGSGVGGTVRALAVSGTNLYAGGEFTTAGGSSAQYVAKWDGSAWSALGSGVRAADKLRGKGLKR